ncbi:hypothetical protein HOI83_03800 [Candidatus Uhrbacteria bacterium]|nr:hypothetical protein [Candidatus Uhrbacteria bacterium]
MVQANRYLVIPLKELPLGTELTLLVVDPYQMSTGEIHVFTLSTFYVRTPGDEFKEGIQDLERSKGTQLPSDWEVFFGETPVTEKNGVISYVAAGDLIVFDLHYAFGDPVEHRYPEAMLAYFGAIDPDTPVVLYWH